MLVLRRKVGDEILIGDSIRLVVVAIRGKQVRLGFEAPQQVSVRRGEIENRCPDVHHVPELEVPELDFFKSRFAPLTLAQWASIKVSILRLSVSNALVTS